MIKKHVFALSLALFTAGVFYTASDAEADTRRTQHTHQIKKQKSILTYFKSTKPAQKQATVGKTQKKKVAVGKTQKKKVVAHRTKKTTVVSKRSASKTNAMAAYHPVSSGRGGGTIGVADDYIGMSEHGNKRQLQGLFNFAFNHKVDPARTPWCAAFANGVLRKSGKKGTGALTAASFLGWGKKTHNPKQGDIVVLGLRKRGASHVGFYMGTVTRNGVKYVAVLGGNQGNRVKVTYYKASRVVAYRTT